MILTLGAKLQGNYLRLSLANTHRLAGRWKSSRRTSPLLIDLLEAGAVGTPPIVLTLIVVPGIYFLARRGSQSQAGV